jgi:hypothetical protein
MDAVGTVRPCPTDLAAICAYKDAIVYGGRRNETYKGRKRPKTHNTKITLAVYKRRLKGKI